VVEVLINAGLVPSNEGDRLLCTQFRSYEWLPRIAYLLWQGDKNASAGAYPHGDILDTPKAIWFIDNFGNCKTTLLHDELHVNGEGTVTTQYGAIPIYQTLKDVPDGEVALVVGSSGIHNDRFVEFVQQGGSAAATFGCKTGDLFIK
jgi:hypothetical protein